MSLFYLRHFAHQMSCSVSVVYHVCALFYGSKDMNNLLFYFILFFYLYNDILGAKDPSYALTLEELSYCEEGYPREYVSLEKFTLYPNHTTSGYVEILQDFPSKSTIKFQGFDQKNKTWVPSPLSIAQLDFCRFFETDVWFVPLMKIVLNSIPERCPIRKTHLTFRSTMLLKRSPGIFVIGCFKGRTSLWRENNVFMCLNVVVKITPYSQRHEHPCIKA